MAQSFSTVLNLSFTSHPIFCKPQKLIRGHNLLQVHRINSPIPCYASTSSTSVSQRKSANYKPNIWNYDYLQSLKPGYADAQYEDTAKKLQEEVRRMIKDDKAEIWTTLELIDDVKRLGLGYNFEKEIREVLNKFLSLNICGGTVVHRSLHKTALCFRLLREYGHDISADIFESFLDQNGNFKTSLVNDVQGMLSLYEASFLSYEGENILVEANAFASFHLKSIHEDRSEILLEHVNHALELPLHYRIQRLEARWYIELYSRRKDANWVLLEAAKLDFNMVQSTLQKDLQEMSSWDIKAIQVLPDYMKISFLALYNTVNELAYDALREQGQNILPYLTKAWSDMLKAFLQEAKWCREKHLPKFDDYLNNAWVSVSVVVILTHAYFLLNHKTTKEALEALENCHAMLKRPSIISRLWNDLGTSTAELQRGEVTNSILCYMHENGVSEEGAHQHIHSLLNETWKKMNRDRFIHSPFPEPFVEIAINLARIAQCTYQNGDGHGAPDSIAKNRVKSLIIEPIVFF